MMLFCWHCAVSRIAPIRPFDMFKACFFVLYFLLAFMEAVELNEEEATRIQTNLFSIISEVEQQNKNATPSTENRMHLCSY
jgi:hypothetical protein